MDPWSEAGGLRLCDLSSALFRQGPAVLPMALAHRRSHILEHLF